MGHIYYTRHGQSLWNIEHRICGATDIPLSEEGHRQAIALGEKIRDEGIVIDEIRYSPLSRTTETALHIAEITGIPAYSEWRLMEQNFGQFEGTATHNPAFLEARKNFFVPFPGGESMLQTATRIYNLLDELKEEDKVYLLVAHNGTARSFESYFRSMTNEEFAQGIGLGNCELLRHTF